MEQTLALISYHGLREKIVGSVVKAYEEMGLSLKGLMITCVGNEFAEKFCEGNMVGPPEYIAFCPVVVMLLEGHDAISRVDQCRIHRRMCYNSYSAESAKKDIKLWFGDDGRQVNWSEEIERQDIAMWHLDGRVEMSKRLESSIAEGTEGDYLWAPRKESQMIFIRIESAAVLGGCVGNIISMLEKRFCFRLRGLRLADKDEAFAKSNDSSVSPPSSGLVKDCGTVVITVWEGDHDKVQKLIKVKDEDRDVKMDDDNLTTEISRMMDLVYISSSTKDILDWFPSGMILRSKYPRYMIFPA